MVIKNIKKTKHKKYYFSKNVKYIKKISRRRELFVGGSRTPTLRRKPSSSSFKSSTAPGSPHRKSFIGPLSTQQPSTIFLPSTKGKGVGTSIVEYDLGNNPRNESGTDVHVHVLSGRLPGEPGIETDMPQKRKATASTGQDYRVELKGVERASTGTDSPVTAPITIEQKPVLSIHNPYNGKARPLIELKKKPEWTYVLNNKGKPVFDEMGFKKRIFLNSNITNENAIRAMRMWTATRHTKNGTKFTQKLYATNNEAKAALKEYRIAHKTIKQLIENSQKRLALTPAQSNANNEAKAALNEYRIPHKTIKQLIENSQRRLALTQEQSNAINKELAEPVYEEPVPIKYAMGVYTEPSYKSSGYESQVSVAPSSGSTAYSSLSRSPSFVSMPVSSEYANLYRDTNSVPVSEASGNAQLFRKPSSMSVSGSSGIAPLSRELSTVSLSKNPSSASLSRNPSSASLSGEQPYDNILINLATGKLKLKNGPEPAATATAALTKKSRASPPPNQTPASILYFQNLKKVNQERARMKELNKRERQSAQITTVNNPEKPRSNPTAVLSPEKTLKTSSNMNRQYKNEKPILEQIKAAENSLANIQKILLNKYGIHKITTSTISTNNKDVVVAKKAEIAALHAQLNNIRQ